MAEHRKSGECCKKGAASEVLVAVSELGYGGFLVGVVHEVDVALEDVRVIFQSGLDHVAVLLVVLILEHVHEGAVVDAVHAQGADEVAFHHPEGLCKKQGVGKFALDAVYDLAPEFVGDASVELLGAHAVRSSSGYVSARARLGIPKPLDVPLGQRHGGIETDYREVSGNGQNLLNDSLTRGWVEEIQLSSIVPGHCCAVVAVEDIGGCTGSLVNSAEGYCGIGSVVIMVFNAYIDIGVVGKIRSVICV